MRLNQGNNFWNRLKAQWYRRGLEHSDFSKKLLPVILPEMRGAKTVLDVGSGCGALSVPLAKKGKTVTALDPSAHMIDILNSDIKKLKIKGVKPVLGAWNGVKLKPHDVIICSNVPELLKDNVEFMKEADKLAKKAVFLITGVDPNADKFYYKELFPLIFGKPLLPKSDYMKTCSLLHSIGIFANVRIIEYDFDQPFNDMDEAVEFWKEYMGIVTGEHDEKLKKFLERKLKKTKTGLLAKFRKKSAVIWWRKDA
ncbi:MAG TPA: methyltransferase domain-containing protein [Thermodesulfobacteriota bacterium]|nr:methyltransferase domain-containing protein [Thermodesulfobacteriota bacterium]